MFMDYKLNMGIWESVFAVPDCVVDKYIKLARGSDLKVLLYIIHNGSKNLSTDKISEDLEISKDSVEEAFLFWEQIGLISHSGEYIHKENESQKVLEESKPKDIIRPTSNITLSPREIAARIDESDEVRYLFEYAEKSFDHILTNTEQRSLIWMRDYLGLPVDVIQMLFEYCKAINKMNVRYIEKVAMNWHEKEIATHEQAENEIQNYIKRHTLSSKIMSAFGLNRKFSSKEEAFIKDWSQKNFDIDIITCAYDKTIDAINKLSFPYINKILCGWYENGLTSIEMIENYYETYSKEKEQNKQLCEFDNLALNISSNGG